jgi:hypothetical protein
MRPAQRIVVWFCVRRLERELRQSQKFQRQCEKIRCFTLAELEKVEQEKIKAKITRLKAIGWRYISKPVEE